MSEKFWSVAEEVVSDFHDSEKVKRKSDRERLEELFRMGTPKYKIYSPSATATYDYSYDPTTAATTSGYTYSTTTGSFGRWNPVFI